MGKSKEDIIICITEADNVYDDDDNDGNNQAFHLGPFQERASLPFFSNYGKIPNLTAFPTTLYGIAFQIICDGGHM